MRSKITFQPEELHYLQLLAKQYPTVQAASTEIINLQAILNLPKGTEHFISDIHGEYEAFSHILNSCSGEVKQKLDERFSTRLSKHDRDELATLIYYPAEKLSLVTHSEEDMDEWYRISLHRLLEVCRWVSSKYTRSKVRKAIPEAFSYIIDELLNINYEEADKRDHYENIINTIINIGQAPSIIEALCETIKRLSVDHLHIVGDIFDRGPRADIVMDDLLDYHSVDIQWGNHDILWMGAASGSRTLVATVLANSIHYNNLEVIETGYGISLRPLSIFANEVYKDCDTHRFKVKLTGHDADQYTEKDKLLSARMHKAITVILFKLEGQKLIRRPEFNMPDRLMLDKIDYETKSIVIDGVSYPLEDCDFPTVDPADPYTLTPEENNVIDQLTSSFRHSEKLQKHVRFLYSKGGLYKIHNGNLLFHGCIPMNEDGTLMTFTIGGVERSGKEFLDYAEKTARKAYYDRIGSKERQFGMDFLWWLWAGRNSPIFGRDRMTTFERRLIKDESVWTETKNPYYKLYQDSAVCDRLLAEFGLTGPHCHIINGHVPVKAKKGENPVKGGGKLIVIDGGFCKAYQPTSGIAGYTLVFNSRNLRIVSHQPFAGREDAIRKNHDIANDSVIFETLETRMKIRETDQGRDLHAQVEDLMRLLEAYKSGAVTEDHQE
ncbi:MAG: fructose-1,6-bisphosphatase [Lachnospiraceae bacterium]|nr:fructose-1,6-bisphosphatase [Lachnospiraceae bacterium]